MRIVSRSFILCVFLMPFPSGLHAQTPKKDAGAREASQEKEYRFYALTDTFIKEFDAGQTEPCKYHIAELQKMLPVLKSIYCIESFDKQIYAKNK